MATLSIPDTWFSDPRRSRLIRILQNQTPGMDPRLVDGIMLEVWRTGQEFAARSHKTGGALPSIRIFDRSEIEAIASCGLAEIRGEHVYVVGSNEAAAYRIKRSLAGTEGGKASGETRRNDSNNLAEANSTKVKQNEAFSFSSSFRKEEEREKARASGHPAAKMEARMNSERDPERDRWVKLGSKIRGSILKAIKDPSSDYTSALSPNDARVVRSARKDMEKLLSKSGADPNLNFLIADMMIAHEIALATPAATTAPVAAEPAREESHLTADAIHAMLPANLRKARPPEGQK